MSLKNETVDGRFIFGQDKINFQIRIWCGLLKFNHVRFLHLLTMAEHPCFTQLATNDNTNLMCFTTGGHDWDGEYVLGNGQCTLLFRNKRNPRQFQISASSFCAVAAQSRVNVTRQKPRTPRFQQLTCQEHRWCTNACSAGCNRQTANWDAEVQSVIITCRCTRVPRGK